MVARTAEPTAAQGTEHGPEHHKVLTEDTINACVVRCKYGVRGEIFLRAQELVRDGLQVTFTSVGNPHQLGQRPLMFLRQVIALCAAPFLMDDPRALSAFPPDVVLRAKKYLKALSGGLGAYQDSKGNLEICQEVCNFIAERDGGHCPSPDDIFIQNGASEAVRLVLQVSIRNGHDGIMVPIPQYPLYSASIALYGGQLVGYHLDESTGWALSMARLQEALDSARSRGIEVRAIVVINPGNPTGQCVHADQLKLVVRFAYTNNLVILADEVYQENVYGSIPFTSLYKTVQDMGVPFNQKQELASFHTVSKGSAGECGFRGGYVHLHNFDPVVRAHMYKIVSINLSPSVPGMVALGCYVNPPRPGDASYELHRQERFAVLESLKRRAVLMSKAFDSMPGVSCQPVDGAMYAFPRIQLPPLAVEAAARAGKAPDLLYCLEMLDVAHIAVTPGSSFEQEDGTFHFRTTILPAEDDFQDLVDRFRRAHLAFLQKYGGLSQPPTPSMAQACPFQRGQAPSASKL